MINNFKDRILKLQYNKEYYMCIFVFVGEKQHNLYMRLSFFIF
jgi:hypothetical protein